MAVVGHSKSSLLIAHASFGPQISSARDIEGRGEYEHVPRVGV